jgi:predicted nucleotidyltransferase
MEATHNEHLRALAQRVADGLPAGLVQEAVLTGSVSRGMADEASDVEMLVVTSDPLELADCFALARNAGLDDLDTWGEQSGPAHRVSGYRERIPVEMICWPGDFAEEQIDRLLAGAMPSTADALTHGIPLRTSGRLAAWKERLRAYPSDLASAQIEEAVLPWAGFAPAGLLTLIRPGDRLALTEWILEATTRTLTVVFALNRVWQPTTKRLAARVTPLSVKPDRLVERIEEALTESDPLRALRVTTELQLDTVMLAPRGPNVDRARIWLREGASILASREPRD